MQSGTFPQLQNEFSANLEILKITKDPAKRHELSDISAIEISILFIHRNLLRSVTIFHTKARLPDDRA